jgi:hypothetical protein
MSDLVEKIQHNSKIVSIHYDRDVESPRDWDNLGTMVCFHKRYQLGDRDHGYNHSDYGSWDEVREAIAKNEDAAIILPLGLIDHSGISMYVGSGAHWCDPGGWDSGTVGFIFVSRDKLRKEYSKKRLSKKTLALAEKCLRAEVKTYDQFLRGDVYWYEVEDAKGNTIDSCGGFFGLEYAKQEALAAAA